MHAATPLSSSTRRYANQPFRLRNYVVQWIDDDSQLRIRISKILIQWFYITEMSVVISIQVCSHIPCICHTIIQCLSLYGKDDWIDKHVWYFTHIGQIKPSIPFLFFFSHWCFVPGHKGKFYIRLLVSWGWDISQSITSTSVRVWQIKHFQVPLGFGTRHGIMCGRHYWGTNRQICSVLVQQNDEPHNIGKQAILYGLINQYMIQNAKL